MQNINKFLTFYDKILIVFIIVFSLGMIIYPFVSAYLSDEQDLQSSIYIKVGSNQVQKIPLTDTYREDPLMIEVNGPLGMSIIEAYNGRVRLKEAPKEDPAKICEKTGWISKSGPSIICVPNRVSIWIEEENSDIDTVSW
ncbi:MAG: NusG domain II-containing protein [Halanaerobiales bacterium]|nr:NusG domain II-containing protein [Halanaerobiales bacterium]